jgi:hypothetical protein
MHRIILIHGTFASNADWIQQDSAFQREIRKYLSHSVIFNKFDWDGRNCHTSRIKSSEKLKLELEHSMKLFPNDKHTVIAHSHGGNIAMYAFSKLEVPIHNLSLVTLATPFIRCSEEKYGGIQGILAIFMIISFLYILILLRINGILYFIVLYPIVVYSIPKFFQLFINYLEKRKDKFLEKIDTTNLKISKFLVVKIEGDEALYWLFGSSLLTNVISRIKNIMFKASFFAYPLFIIVAISIALGSFFNKKISNLFDYDFNLIEDHLWDFWMVSFFIILCLFCLAIIISIIAIPLYFVFRCNPLIFGWENFLTALSLNLFPSSTPNETISFETLAYSSDVKLGKGLLHSQPYINNEIIASIGRWIR